MGIIKIITNGYPQGIEAITEREEVTNALLDEINNGNKHATTMLELHLKEKGMCFIPKENKPFEWDNNLHGDFINQD